MSSKRDPAIFHSYDKSSRKILANIRYKALTRAIRPKLARGPINAYIYVRTYVREVREPHNNGSSARACVKFEWTG